MQQYMAAMECASRLPGMTHAESYIEQRFPAAAIAWRWNIGMGVECLPYMRCLGSSQGAFEHLGICDML